MKDKIKYLIKTNRTKIKSKIFQIATIIIIVDQFTKILVSTYLKEFHGYEIIKGFFMII